MITQEVAHRLTKLLSVLRQHSMHDVIQWSTIGAEEYSVSAARASYIIRTQDKDGVEPYVFGMYDSNGATVAEISSGDEEYPQEIRQGVRDLWIAVHTSAPRMTRFLDKALEDLEELPPF